MKSSQQYIQCRIKYFPSINSGLFTSLKFISTYNSMSTPVSDNRITGQVGFEF